MMATARPTRRQSKPPLTRDRLEELIEAAIALLDEIDGDENLEPNLGSAPWPPGRYALDTEHDPAEQEPSLGSVDRAINQERWGKVSGWFSGEDLELDRSDHEPNLGSVGGCSQELWAQGIDAEENGDERDWDGDEGDAEFNDENEPIFPVMVDNVSSEAIAEEDRVFRFIDRVKRRAEGAHP